MLDRVDDIRRTAGTALDTLERAERGQFFTSKATARRMAAMFRCFPPTIRVLDPGSGTGMLFSAFVEESLARSPSTRQIAIAGYESDRKLMRYWRQSLDACIRAASPCGVKVSGDIRMGDFIRHGVETIERSRAASVGGGFTHAIMNPPYRKLHSRSPSRADLNRLGLALNNLYSAFLMLASMMLCEGGELVAIVPRSFCNGPYFRFFRKQFLGLMSVERIHLFESRTTLFADDAVLQENVIVYARKIVQSARVLISSSAGSEGPDTTMRQVPFVEIVSPDDPEMFIHVAIGNSPDVLPHSRRSFGVNHALSDLGISVSTGRVVDFRVEPQHLHRKVLKRTQPLLYPLHFVNGEVRWPVVSKRFNSLSDCPATAKLWMPGGVYVVVKRFSSKEAKRRIDASVFDASEIPCSKVAFENHLNVFHSGGAGLDKDFATGLACFLNSEMVDLYFRRFSGHTQVNATDLRSLLYPPVEVLKDIGRRVSRVGGWISDSELASCLNATESGEAEDEAIGMVNTGLRPAALPSGPARVGPLHHSV